MERGGPKIPIRPINVTKLVRPWKIHTKGGMYTRGICAGLLDLQMLNLDMLHYSNVLITTFRNMC